MTRRFLRGPHFHWNMHTQMFLTLPTHGPVIVFLSFSSAASLTPGDLKTLCFSEISQWDRNDAK